MYQPRPMLKRGYQDKSAGMWGNLLGSIVGGVGSGIGAAIGGPVGAGAGAAIGGGLGGMARDYTTNALDDSTPDQMMQRQARGSNQDQLLQSLLRRYGLV